MDKVERCTPKQLQLKVVVYGVYSGEYKHTIFSPFSFHPIATELMAV